MDYRLLGRTGLRVSPLCLGTMNFGMRKAGGGVQTEEDDGVPDHGSRPRRSGSTSSTPPTSTATVAGSPSRSSAGGSRRATAAARRRCSRPRSTTRASQWPNDGTALGAAHPAGVRRQPAPAADRSHRPVPDAPRRPRHAVGGDLAGDGPARRSRARCSTSGSSNFAGWHIVQGERGGASDGARSGSCRSRASTTSTPARSSSRCCPRAPTTASASSRGARSVAGCSAACSPTAPPGSARRRAASRRRSRRMRTKLEAWEKLCAELGAHPADVALAWLLHNPVVTAPIIGPADGRAGRRGDWARSTSSSTTTCSPSSTEIFPGPGGPAPEAYAW